MRRIIRFAAPLLAVAAVLATTEAAAQQYKWVDKDGRTQYGDFPPPGVKATPLRAPPAPVAVPGTKGLADREAENRKKAAEAAKARDKQDVADKDAETRKRNCDTAQANLRGLETGRVRRVDPKGEYVFLDDAQIAKETAETRKAVADWCK